MNWISFVFVGNLKSHYRINHSKENLLNCNQCSYQASSRKAFKEHFKTHEIEKPVSCTQCNYTCVNRAALKAHMKIHSESRPYKCEFCAYMSRQSGNVRTHMKKKHADKLKLKKTAIHLDQAPSIDAKKELKRQKGWPLVRKAFKCDLCEASFVRDDSLRSHKRQHRELSQVCIYSTHSGLNLTITLAANDMVNLQFTVNEPILHPSYRHLFYTLWPLMTFP